MIDEYFKHFDHYHNSYGKKTMLLFQVGSFFEVYGLVDEESHEIVKQFCDITGYTPAQKKITIGKKTAIMAGFRDYLLEKMIEKFHPHGYTIVVYIQEGDEEDGTKSRILQGIYSPGTTFIEQSQVLSNNMSCIWIQKVKMVHKEQYIFGLSNINLMNHKSILCEHHEQYYHNPTTYDTIESFLNIYNPIEFVLIHNVSLDIIQGIVQYLKIKSKKCHVIDLNNHQHTLSIQANRCENHVYQNEIILSFFPKMNVEIFKANSMDKPIAYQSYCFLLNFIKQHNVNLVENLEEPHVQQVDDVLVCANHSLYQLNIIEHNGDYGKEDKYGSVIGVLNQCKTKMGKRLFHDILLHPINNIDTLETQYNIIEHLLQREFYFDQELGKIADLEKMLTKLKLQKLNPCDIYHIYDSHTILKIITNQFYKKKDKCIWDLFQLNEVQTKWTSFTDYIKKTFQLDICQQMNHLQFDKFEIQEGTIFHRGVNQELDHLIQTKMESENKLDVILETLEACFHKKEKNIVPYIKKHQTNSGEICLLCTKLRCKTLEKQIKEKYVNKGIHSIEIPYVSSYNGESKTMVFPISELYFSSNATKKDNIIGSKEIDELTSTITQENHQYQEVLRTTYKESIFYIYTQFFDHLISIIECVRQIDVYNTKCGLTKSYNLCRPQVQNSDYSFVDAKKMRHLLIELIDTNETYVPNDICLGKEENQKGILLYGTNSVGKTSLIKALGINVIMAQCGLYVPCESFVFSPYHYLFTRIIGNDNLFKGLSTFGVEMSELRVILKDCNKRSLILGDELCSGTEIDSALSIFISSLEVMCERQSSFIFATHFHELQQMKEMKALTSIQCKHLKVKFDHEKQELYYDRTIHDGQGESIYGLEVCKSLKMQDPFLQRCYEIRNSYIQNKNNILLLKTSKYNSSKLRNMCEFCHKNVATEIHHLKYQKEANDQEYIDNSFHKNHCANLASICETCHDHIHALNLRFEKRKLMNGEYEFILKKIEYK